MGFGLRLGLGHIWLVVPLLCFIACSGLKIKKILRSPFGDQLEKYSCQMQIFRHQFVYAAHLIGCDQKSEIVRYFQGRLCDKKGL